MKNNHALTFTVMVFAATSTAAADSYQKLPDFKNSREMANYYNERIEQRERENLEQLHFEQERGQRNRIENELRELKENQNER